MTRLKHETVHGVCCRATAIFLRLPTIGRATFVRSWQCAPKARDLLRAHARLLSRVVRKSGFRDGCPIATVLLKRLQTAP